MSPANYSLTFALVLAALGRPVFPCSALKRPAIAKAKGGNGFHDASTSSDRVREMWARAGDAAQLVGVPTGAASGIDVLDIDPRHNGHLWEAEHRDRLGETRIHGTMSGGRHWLFRHVDGVANSASKIGPGVDTRGQGGYIIFPPSTGYTVVRRAVVAPWPDWLLPLVLKATPATNSPTELHGTPPAEISDKRVAALIEQLLDNVRNAADGTKHVTLRSSGISLGGYLHLTTWTEAEAVEALVGALPSAKDWNLARRTAAWAIAQGRLRPQTLPDRPYEGRRAA